MTDDSVTSTGSRPVRGDAWSAVAAFLGALGVGYIFANLWREFGRSMLLVDTYWLSADLSWPRLIPALAVVTMMLVAVLAGRWGWVVAGAGLALHYSVYEWNVDQWLDPRGAVLLLVVPGTAALGGALAAFGAADRAGRLAIGAGLAFGTYGRLTLLDISLFASSADARLRLLVPLALCVVAAVVWLVRGVGRSGPVGSAAAASGAAESGAGASGAAGSGAVETGATAAQTGATATETGVTGTAPAGRSWATPGMAVGVAVVATFLYLALMALLDSLGRRSGSPRRLEAIELLYQVGLFGIVVAAGIALGIYAYRRGGSVPARWVLVGLATGTVSLFTGGVPALSSLMQQSQALWLTIGVAAAGVVLGVVLSRFAAVPWDGLGLIALAVGIVLRSPQGQIEFVEQDTNLWLFVVFTVAFVFAASLSALTTQMSLRGLGAPREVAALVGLGFAASVLATSIIFPASLLVNQRGSLGLGPAITVAIMAVGVLALYGLGRLARSLRRAIEAEARREAGLTAQ